MSAGVMLINIGVMLINIARGGLLADKALA
jgi:lactate dehydrogenase-like 2-hydroxyacid dehydrogenase